MNTQAEKDCRGVAYGSEDVSQSETPLLVIAFGFHNATRISPLLRVLCQLSQYVKGLLFSKGSKALALSLCIVSWNA